MDPLTMAAIMAGVGLLKGMTVDRVQESKDRELKAAQLRVSPWIQMPLQQVREANPMGNALQGGIAGYDMGQKAQDRQDAKDFRKSYLALLDKKASSLPTPTLDGSIFNAPEYGSPSGSSAWHLLPT